LKRVIARSSSRSASGERGRGDKVLCHRQPKWRPSSHLASLTACKEFAFGGANCSVGEREGIHLDKMSGKVLWIYERRFRLLMRTHHGRLQDQKTLGSRLGSLYYNSSTTLTTLAKVRFVCSGLFAPVCLLRFILVCDGLFQGHPDR
jgi:hypothetical protein